jgi:predicted metal-dependent hydrolase
MLTTSGLRFEVGLRGSRFDRGRVQIQVMTQKWASCSIAGTVSFSSDLLEMSREFGEAVIVHELVHLRVPNHGKLFQSLVRSFTKGQLPEVNEERIT